MKIANWNLQRILPTERRATAIQEHLLAIDADIWTLTETHEQVGPGDNYSSVMSGDPDRDSKPGERWTGIWSRFPIQPLPSFVSDSARCTAARISHPEIGDIVVYATVLPWLGSTWGEYSSADGASFEAALNTYVLDWQRLRAAFPDALCVVAGDFNQDLAPYHYYGSKKQLRLLESGLAAAGLVARTSNVNDPIDWEPKHRYACIDHICTSEVPRVQIGQTIRWPESDKPNPRLSDHFGVAIELSRS